MSKRSRRRVCFVTGTRAEFGLMQSTLRAIAAHPSLQLQIVATGMHLDRSRGRSIDLISAEGWKIDRVVKWAKSDTPARRAAATGKATAALAASLGELRSDIVLVVGDRVEAFATAAAGHLSDRVVAHIHGGDRALGQADDSLRHAITKLAHIHFPATPASEKRILAMGEDAWRVHRVGAPGVDGIVAQAVGADELRRRFPQLAKRRYALLILHPAEPDASAENRRAKMVHKALSRSGVGRIVVVMPNNDPGAEGIARAWRAIKDDRTDVVSNLSRDVYLGLLRDAAMLIGNSSSGIIEAASFGTPVIDIGPRQAGREHGENVVHVNFRASQIQSAIKLIWRNGQPRRFASENIYAPRGKPVGARIASVLSRISRDVRTIRKLITY